jgi:hypothetical protein
MLQELLNLLEESQGQLSQDEICTRLGVSPASLQAMLDILVRKGRISAYEIQGDGICATPCEDCPVHLNCSLTKDYQETIFSLDDKS